MDLLIPLAALAIMTVVCGLIGFLATLKGFRFWAWFFSGLLGMIVCLFLPSAKEPGISDIERGIRANRGNSVGKWISVVYVALVVLSGFSRVEEQSGVADYQNPDTTEIRSK